MNPAPNDWEHMGRPDITAALGRMLVKDVFHYPDPRIYWANEVTYDYTLAHPIRVDFMRIGCATRFRPVWSKASSWRMR